MQFTVLTDTSGNLPAPVAQARGIRVLPFIYTYDGEEHTCTDTDAFDAEAYYGRIKQGLKVTTSQITPESFAAFFEGPLSEGSDVIFVSMSSGISGSCDSARMAAQTLSAKYPDRRLEIIDTHGASLGEGLIALRAADLRDANAQTEQAAQQLRALAERMFNVFTVDDLNHLRRGGRLSNLSALLGTVLGIKPLLKGDTDRKIVAFGKVRGRRKSIEALAAMYEKLAAEPEAQTVGIAQAACREDAQTLVSLLNKNRPPREILTVDYEPVTGAHVGPGALALFFESSPGVRLYGEEGVSGSLKDALKVGEKALSKLSAASETARAAIGKAGETARSGIEKTLRRLKDRDKE
ncbi:MAG: DegV family protein [Clostridia bacterium]|nr:DegV family protein [Clostridia bacterium]